MTRSEMTGKRLNDNEETVEGVCHHGNALNTSGGSERTADLKTIIG